MKFRNLQPGDRFRFVYTDPMIDRALASGPWVKAGRLTYTCDRGFTHRVGKGGTQLPVARITDPK